MSDDVTATGARQALDAVQLGRQHVVDEIDVPRWYWATLAGGWIVLGFLTDLGHPWLTVVATLVFGAAHASISQTFAGGRRRTGRLSIRADVAGRRAPLLVIGWVAALGLVTIIAALGAHADGARHPVTMASILVAAMLVFGGPQLMASIRRHAVQRPAGAA
ncbi:MAG: hypothetical protein ABIR68_18520 [Ilumatobacteraceae bacterium]